MATLPRLTRRRAVTAITSLAAASAVSAASLVTAPAASAAQPAAGRRTPAGVRPSRPSRPSQPDPLASAHAHNDYEHERPLLDALSHGFTSVEADIWLVDGELLVAHDAVDLDPSRTLRSLYLDPLLERVLANRGSVYRGHDVSLQLLVDIKNTGAETYRELSRQLRRYGSLCSSVTPGGRVRTRAVTAVVSGERDARVPMEAERHRHAFYDGRLEDLAAAEPAPASFIPLISSNWTSSFRWAGVGAFPEAERALLAQIVDTAHARGQRVRFWATPDVAGPARDAVWRELVAAGVDHINTDDLAGLEAFLRANGG